MLCCKWTLPLPGNADLSEILQNSEESWIQKRNIEPNVVYLNVCFHFCSWDKDNEAINNIRQKSLDVRDKFLTVEEHRSEVPLSGQNPENRQLKLTKLLTKLQLFLNDPEQNQELSKNDTISGSIFAHHPTAVRLTPMGGIACTPIQRLLQNSLTEARQEASAPAGDAGASTSAAGRLSADEKPMSRRDQEKATVMRSEDKREYFFKKSAKSVLMTRKPLK